MSKLKLGLNVGKTIKSVDSLRLRLLEQCFKYQSSHLGSAFSSLPILREIFLEMNERDRFILSNGHAASALYVILEEFRGKVSDEYFIEMGDHPKRTLYNGIDCSTGSLGMGITVAVGMAIANPEKSIFCLVSDGECAEGSVWEALRFATKKSIPNLYIYFSLNGWSAYDVIDSKMLAHEIRTVYPNANIRFSSNYPFEDLGIRAHYHKLSKEDFESTLEKLCEANL